MSRLQFSCSVVPNSWTAACQASLAMEFSRQEYWSGLPFPSRGDLPNPGTEPRSPALQAYSLPTELWGKSLKPLVVQLNWRDFLYKRSAWGQDSTPSPNSSLYWVAPLPADARWVQDNFSSATRFIPKEPYCTLNAGFFGAPAQLPLF